MSQLDVKFDYDIAFSYASEQRDYVKPLAIKLRNIGIKVFYDEFEEHNLWGKDLPEYLEEIYWKKSKYCVIFISDEYAKKNWTTHEKKSALARSIEERIEYILPVRFDDTEIPGIRTTIGYIDARKKSIEQLAEIIERKLSSEKRPHAESVSSHTDTKAEALYLARDNCIKQKTERVIHNKDGKIQNSNSYSNYFSDMLTDQRRDREAKTQELEHFQEAASQMPDLISEMKKDLFNPELKPIREFFLAKKIWTINFGDEPRFIYYEEDHPGLWGKIKVLDNFGYVIEVRPGTLPIYRMKEDFVRLLKDA